MRLPHQHWMPDPHAATEAARRVRDDVNAIDELGFTYAQVESALAQVYEIDEQSAGAFRGRIKNFQRLGIVLSSPGKGKKIMYDFTAVALWGFGLALAEFGIAPEYIKRIIAMHGTTVVSGLGRPKPSDNGEIGFWLSPRFLTQAREPMTVYSIAVMLAESGIGPLSEVSASALAHKRGALIINLTTLRGQLVKCLSAATKRQSTE